MRRAGQGLCLPQPSCQTPSPPAGPGEDITPQNAALPGSGTPQPPHTVRQEEEEEGCASSGACSAQGFGMSRFHCSPALPLARGRCRRWQRWHWHTSLRAARSPCRHTGPRGTRQRWAVGAGGRPPPCRQPPKLGCARQCLVDPFPLTLWGLAAVSGQVGEAMGFSPPPPPQVAAPCCNQTSLTFPLRVPALAGGDDSPAHSGISKPTALSSLLLFQLRLEGSERTRQEVGEEGESSPGAQQGGSRARSPAKAQLGTGREQKPLASTPDPQVRLHRAAASQ